MRRALKGSWLFGAAAIVALLAAWPAPTHAGPPYVTDDAEPTDLGHWEIYNFVTGIGTPGEVAGEGGFDLNYGAAKNLQLTLVLPAQFQTGVETGPGQIEVAAKYKFLHQAPGSWTPDVAFFPRLFAPTGASQFGPSRLGLLLPLWAEKDWGKWSLFGGGGYDINPGPDNRNNWQSGVALSRALSDRLSLGGEIYHQTAQTRDGRDFTGLNGGAIYKVTSHWSLLVSGGPGIQNARQQGQYDFYFALEATY